MTKIQDLPEEIILLIFENIIPHSLDNLQLVCKSWHKPARIVSLKSIRLSDPKQLERFITSIDSNPNPQYLNAVKRLSFSTPHPRNFNVLEGQDIRKVFFRFPNLKSVRSYGGFPLFEQFNDQVCREFLDHCRKLETFEFSRTKGASVASYFDLANRLRLLLTRLDVQFLNQVNGGIVTFIKSFPRLQYLDGESALLNSFRHILAILETLPNLIQFSVLTANDEEDTFAEKILTSKEENTAITIIQRLSNVNELTWGCARNLCINSAKFIAKYFTGLKTLNIHSHSSNDWNDRQVQGFTSTILDLVVSQPHCHLFMENMITSSFSFCLSALFTKMNDRINSGKILQVKLLTDDDDFEDTTLVNIRIDCNSGRFEPTISVSVKHDEEFNIQQLASEVLGPTPLNDLDEFVLEIEYRLSDYALAADIDMYNDLFKVIPSVKKITLDIPITFKEKYTKNDTVATYPTVEHLILRATKDTEIYSDLYDKFCAAFPRLKCLELYYNCGCWDVDRGEFYLNLDNFSLDNLVVDVTPLVDDVYAGVRSDYFVVLANIGKINRAFKIQKDFSTVSIIDFERYLADGLYPGSDYLLIYLNVKHVGHLELYLNTASKLHEEEMYMHQRKVDDNDFKYVSLSIR